MDEDDLNPDDPYVRIAALAKLVLWKEEREVTAAGMLRSYIRFNKEVG
ncbi:hypothetical protein BH23CHL5_BH23CHL5_28280 [soil metagenome]